MNTAEIIYERVKNLSEPLAQEVLNFINFITLKRDHGETENLMLAQQSSLAGIWDNAEDEVWDHAAMGDIVLLPLHRESLYRAKP